MKINFNKPITDLSGEPIMEGQKAVMLGRTIANALITMTQGDALKYLGWAQKMFDGQEVEMDESDVRIFTGFLDATQTLTILTKGQALRSITAAEKSK